MALYTNRTNIPLSMAVFLANDHYSITPGSISVTSLLKPVRPLILSSRVKPETRQVDVADLIPARMGTSIHDSIRNAWVHNKEKAMAALGYPAGVIKRVVVNPDPDTLGQDDIPVYTELRTTREYRGYLITGEFDFVAEGRVEDFKSTSTYTWQSGSKDDDYILQGSMYRWLNPKIITKDDMAINYIFTDWSAKYLKSDPTYPRQRMLQKSYPLRSIPETQQYIDRKLNLIEMFRDADEKDIPRCSDEELWRTQAVFKYYKNRDKTERSTKNFDTYQEAHALLVKHGSTGIIVEKRGEVKACRYCPAYDACSQKNEYLLSGELSL